MILKSLQGSYMTSPIQNIISEKFPIIELDQTIPGFMGFGPIIDQTPTVSNSVESRHPKIVRKQLILGPLTNRSKLETDFHLGPLNDIKILDNNSAQRAKN
jgi:hypothetical protein